MIQVALKTHLTFDEMIELIEMNNHSNGIIAVDTETNYKKDERRDIRDGTGWCIGVSVAGRLTDSMVVSGYAPFRHKRGTNLDVSFRLKLKEALENFQGWIVFHNAKFDLASLTTLGINYTGKFYCTMVMCHILNENFPYAKDLTSCVRVYVDKTDSKKDTDEFKMLVKLLGWDGVPAEEMVAYAAYDPDLTLRLLEKIKPLFDKEVPESYWEHKQDFIRCIIAMEGRGIEINQQLCDRMSAVGRLQMEETAQILGYNLASSKDLEKLLIQDLKLPVIRRGKSGRPSFDKEIMAEYEQILEHRDGDTTAETVLTYRGWQKAVTSNYEPYVTLLSPDGRLRPNYKLHGTKTGRLSCEKPNLQQIPKVSNKPWNGKMKSAFVAQEGWDLYEGDYMQLEFRIGASYGQQKNLLDIFNEIPNRDIFEEMSKDLGENRYDTKQITYTIQFNAGGPKIGWRLGRTAEEGIAIKERWYAMYPGIKKVSDRAMSVAKHKGKVQLWSQRYRHFMYPEEEAFKAFNSVCQGGAADLVNYAMVRLFKTVDNEEECRMLLQVHDSVVFEIKKGLEDKYLPLIREAMENDNPEFGVRFPIDLHLWGED